MAQETRNQPQVESYQTLKKWYLTRPSLKLRIIRYEWRVSGSIQWEEECSLLHFGVEALEKGAFGSPWTTVDQLTYIYIYIYIYTCVLFSSIKLELGVIPSGKKPFNSEHLNFPGEELNVTDITEK